MLAFEHFRSQGYEGARVRNKDGEYESKRSSNLQKLKNFDDSEYKVVGLNEGRGKMTGRAIFMCETADETQFLAKMIGEPDSLKKYVDKPALAHRAHDHNQISRYHESQQSS